MEKQYDNILVKKFLYFNLYVIKGVDGDILIDTGFIGMRRKLKKWLDNFDIKLVILTHAHVDHIWNASYIKKLYGCDIAMGGMDIENIDNTKINSKPLNNHYRAWAKLMNFGMKKFVANKFDVDILLSDNQTMKKYGNDLKFVSLSGHTNGSMGILYNNYLFAGDALVNRGKYPSLAFQNQDNKNALKSGQKVMELDPKMVFLGHDREFIMTKEIKENLLSSIS